MSVYGLLLFYNVDFLKLKSRGEWEKYCKEGLPGKLPKPADIPATPRRKYKNKGWVNWGDWLGN